MHYVALVEGEERHVEIAEIGPDQFELRMLDRTLVVDSKLVSETTQSMIAHHEAFSVESEQSSEGGENVLVRRHVVHVEVVDLRTLRMRKAQEEVGAPEGPAGIVAPMPGKVIAVLVEEGQTVKKGQGLVVVEAMKMENELRAPKAGIVKNVTVSEGQVVEGGVALMMIA